MTFAVFDDGTRWSFADALAAVRATAAGLQTLGVAQGDPVLIMLPNGALGLRAMFAANYIGAVMVPVNPAYRGTLLEHVIADSGATVAIVDPGVLDRVLAAPLGALRRIVVADDDLPESPPDGVEIHGRSVLLDPEAEPRPISRDAQGKNPVKSASCE